MIERKDWSTEFESLVNRAFEDFPLLTEFQFPRATFTAAPALDVYEKEGKYFLDVFVPGYEAKDVHVEVNGSTVTVSGSHKDAEEKKGARFYRREMRFGSFMRSVTLPQDIAADKVEAAMNKGILTITLFPIKPIAAKRIAIKGE